MFQCYLFIVFILYLQGPQMFRPVFSEFSIFVVPNFYNYISKTWYFIQISEICLQSIVLQVY